MFESGGIQGTNTDDQEHLFHENLKTDPRKLFGVTRTMSAENGFVSAEANSSVGPRGLYDVSDLNNNSGCREKVNSSTYRKRTGSASLLERGNNVSNCVPVSTQGGTITNNMTSHAMSTGTKTALSDIENSFQNIKHKTPVNQVRQRQPLVTSNKTIAEDSVKVQNMSACKIQRWYRRHSCKRRAGEAAMKRLLDTKKYEKEEQLRKDGDYLVTASRNFELDKKKRREESARQARQHAIEVS